MQVRADRATRCRGLPGGRRRTRAPCRPGRREGGGVPFVSCTVVSSGNQRKGVKGVATKRQ